jgi:hypothetical protein
LLAHVSGACAAAEPIANAVSKPATIHRVIVTSREITSPRPAATAPHSIGLARPGFHGLAQSCAFRALRPHGSRPTSQALICSARYFE